MRYKQPHNMLPTTFQKPMDLDDIYRLEPGARIIINYPIGELSLAVVHSPFSDEKQVSTVMYQDRIMHIFVDNIMSLAGDAP